jgi:hypothetical protein
LQTIATFSLMDLQEKELFPVKKEWFYNILKIE